MMIDKGVFIAAAIFGVAMFGGWGANIVKIALTVGDPVSDMFVLRCVGAFFPPIGAVLGYL